MKLTTTFAKLKEARACTEGYRKLAKTLLAEDESNLEVFGKDTEINLLTILETNGVQGMLWCLRATLQDSKQVSRLMAADFAESVLGIFEKTYPDDLRPGKAIQVARSFANGEATLEELQKARKDADAAADTAYAADAAYAYAAAYAAADAAYAYAAADAADAAAYAAYAAYAAAAADTYARKSKQTELIAIIRSYLSWE